MAVLITGANGYLGTFLVKAIKRDNIIKCLTPSRKELDLTDYHNIEDYFSKNNIESVIHLAASLDNNDLSMLYKSNIIGLYNLLNICKIHRISKFIFASGNNVYGSSNGRSFEESNCCEPMIGNSYGLSKYCGELLIRDFLSDSGVKYAIIRIADIYGPNQKTGALIKAVIENLKHNKPQKLFGKGDRIRDYIYIDDVVEGIMYIYANNLVGIYNLSTGIGTSVLEVVNIANRLSEVEQPLVNITVEYEDHSKVVLNNNKLHERGFTPKTTFVEGLNKIVTNGGK